MKIDAQILCKCGEEMVIVDAKKNRNGTITLTYMCQNCKSEDEVKKVI